MKIGEKEQLHRIPLTFHVDLFEHWIYNLSRKAQIMRHCIHRNCFEHWKEWVTTHGQPTALDCSEFCPRCTDMRKFIGQEGYVCMSTGMFGLLVNRFHLDP
jgi:hypothetical protein